MLWRAHISDVHICYDHADLCCLAQLAFVMYVLAEEQMKLCRGFVVKQAVSRKTFG